MEGFGAAALLRTLVPKNKSQSFLKAVAQALANKDEAYIVSSPCVNALITLAILFYTHPVLTPQRDRQIILGLAGHGAFISDLLLFCRKNVWYSQETHWVTQPEGPLALLSTKPSLWSVHKYSGTKYYISTRQSITYFPWYIRF